MGVAFQVACEKFVICSSNSIKLLCWVTLFRGEVAAGGSSAMVRNNDEALLTTKEWHKRTTMSL